MTTLHGGGLNSTIEPHNGRFNGSNRYSAAVWGPVYISSKFPYVNYIAAQLELLEFPI